MWAATWSHASDPWCADKGGRAHAAAGIMASRPATVCAGLHAAPHRAIVQLPSDPRYRRDMIECALDYDECPTDRPRRPPEGQAAIDRLPPRRGHRPAAEPWTSSA